MAIRYWKLESQNGRYKLVLFTLWPIVILLGTTWSVVYIRCFNEEVEDICEDEYYLASLRTYTDNLSTLVTALRRCRRAVLVCNNLVLHKVAYNVVFHSLVWGCNNSCQITSKYKLEHSNLNMTVCSEQYIYKLCWRRWQETNYGLTIGHGCHTFSKFFVCLLRFFSHFLECCVSLFVCHILSLFSRVVRPLGWASEAWGETLRKAPNISTQTVLSTKLYYPLKLY